MPPEVKYYTKKMLTFKTNVLGGPPFYMGTVTYNKIPSDSHQNAYYGYLNSAPTPIDLDNSRRKVCVHYSLEKDDNKPLDLRQIAVAMRAIIKTINNCENDRIRLSRRRPVLGDTDAHFAV